MKGTAGVSVEESGDGMMEGTEDCVPDEATFEGLVDAELGGARLEPP